MGDLSLSCPLCCNKTYDSKETLLEHLTSTLENLYCPLCNQHFDTLSSLTKHLGEENCMPDSNNDEKPISASMDYESEFPSETDPLESLDNDDPTEMNSNAYLPVQNIESVDDVGKMYVELIKPPLQTQELKLVKQSGDRYVIIADDHPDLTSGTIVTKQNQDGTISLTTVKDMKLEPDPLTGQSETEPEGNTEEMYSCNTCGVSFTSVIEHIQNYHNNQDVVVEGSLEESEMPIDYDTIECDEVNDTEKTPSRRVITDNGDIVEAPIVLKSGESLEPLELVNNMTVPIEFKQEQPNEKKPRTSKRYIQVDKLCDSVIKDLKTDLTKVVPYHKVTSQEIINPNGTKVKEFTCMWCKVTVNALADFKDHPCKPLKYSCSQCTVSYDNSKSLCAHMKMHKAKPIKDPEVAETFECEYCCTVFLTNKSLKLHKRMHDPQKSRPIEMPVPSKNNTDTGRYKCNVCDKLIPMAYKTVHQNSHKKGTMLNCTICNKKFTSAMYLDMHMNVHNIDKVPQSQQDKTLPYSCLYCDRRFTRPHEKVKHERIHTGEKPHSCEICGKSFRVSYCLTLHMRTHTGARPYACQYCGKRFKAHSVYNHHLLTHSDVRAYKCPFCPKAFKTSVQLAGHKNSHTKPFSCTHCNRPFASLYAVRAHMETHARSNNLKYACALCGATYVRAFALKDHVRTHHPDSLQHETESDWMTIKNTTNENDGIQDGIDLNKEMLTSTANEIKMELTNNEFIVPT